MCESHGKLFKECKHVYERAQQLLLAPPLPHTHALCRLHSLDIVSSAAADGFHSLALEHNAQLLSRTLLLVLVLVLQHPLPEGTGAASVEGAADEKTLGVL